MVKCRMPESQRITSSSTMPFATRMLLFFRIRRIS